jgi:hypothetical protein
VSLNIVDLSPGNTFFKPDQYLGTPAILVEVKQFQSQVPTAKYGPKDTIIADLTIFTTDAELANGAPTVIKGAQIQQQYLVRDLQAIVGSATIVKLSQSKPKTAGQRPAWVWGLASPQHREQVLDYVNKREAEVQAALDSAPDFE